jgi:hypothetical protein
VKFEEVERFAFYERAKKAFAVVATGYISILQLSLGAMWQECNKWEEEGRLLTSIAFKCLKDIAVVQRRPPSFCVLVET